MDFKENSRAIYLQIADVICDRVLSGAIRGEDRIPSVREYAATVAVNVNTVMRAYDYLSGLNIIYNKRGLGYFATADVRERVLALRRQELLGEAAEEFFRSMRLLDVTPEQLSDMYKKFIDKTSVKDK